LAVLLPGLLPLLAAAPLQALLLLLLLLLAPPLTSSKCCQEPYQANPSSLHDSGDHPLPLLHRHHQLQSLQGEYVSGCRPNFHASVGCPRRIAQA
jgi:hypothetical protein